MTAAADCACYVFGILPAGAAVPDYDRPGLASRLRLVTEGQVAALVSSLPHGRSLGRASDLLAHDEVLGRLVAAGTPVLPMRFGAVLSDERTVVTELLRAHEDEFRSGLDRVRGRVQYTVKARYHGPAVLREILADHPELDRLRGDGSLAGRLRLGESVVAALERRRPADAATLLAELGEVDQVRIGEPAEPDDVLDAAVLVRRGAAGGFERRVAELGRRHADRFEVRVLGPSAAYDFVDGS